MKRIENQCNGKIPFDTKEEANISATHLNKQKGSRLKSYQCKVCGHIHLGHEAKGKLEKRSKKLINYNHESGVHIFELPENFKNNG